MVQTSTIKTPFPACCPGFLELACSQSPAEPANSRRTAAGVSMEGLIRRVRDRGLPLNPGAALPQQSLGLTFQSVRAAQIESWEPPSAMKICGLVLASYFAITAGIAYDIINEPPSMGGVQDPVSGKVMPQTFMPYRMNGQYIIEGLVGAMMYTMGGLGLIALHVSHSKKVEAKYRSIILYTGCVALFVAYFSTQVFIRIKMPSYLREESY